MSNTNKTVTLTVDVQAKLGDLQGQVNKIQQMLKGLHMPDSLTQSTNRGIGDLLDRIKKVQELTESNKIKLIDERKVQSELNNIQKDFKQLVERLNANGAKIKIGDTKATDALRKGIDQYKKGVDAATTAVKEQKKAVEELNAELTKKQNKVSRAEQYKQDAELMVKEAEETAKKVKEAEEKYRKDNKDKDWSENQFNANWKKKALYNGLDPEADNKVAEARKNLTQKTKNLQKAQEELRVEGSKIQKDLDAENKLLEELEANLKQISDQELTKIKNELDKLQKDGGAKFNFDPQSIQSVEQLEAELEKVDGQDLSKITQVLESLGIICRDAAQGADDLDKGIEENVESFKELDSTIEGFKTKAAYFFGMANAVQLLQRAVRSAFNTIKDLDEVMTETAVVTDFSVGDMWAQLPEYTKRANELGVSIHDAYEAATLYYQQGLKTDQVIQVSNETLKMARIAGLGAAEATDRMTNALRGFNMEINEDNAQRVNDVYSKLAAITAADTDEISTAMTKVASLAHNANMEFETTSAFLSQMIETTRESAETAGTALKTVIARFSEVKKLYNQGDLMGTDEEGEEIDVNKVSQALRSAGINLNEYLTGAKGLDDIFIELASKWENLDMVQQRYIATMAAGSRQQSRFIAMMSDYDRTMELVTAANTSAGASQQQFEKTLDSLKSKLAQLKNSWDTLMMGITNDELVKGAIDLLKELLDILNKIFETTDKITDTFTGGMGGGIVRISALFMAFKIGNVIVTKAIGLYKVLASEKVKDAAATDLVTKAEGKEIIAQKASTIAKLKGVLAGKQDVATKGAQAGATNVATTSTWGFVGATLALTAALLALVAIIAVIIYLYKEHKKNSPEEVFKRSQESANAAASAADELADSYNNLNESLDSLDDKYKNLEKLTRGTQEWNNAVREINNEVLDLMTNYDNLEIKNENGVLKVANPETVQSEYQKRYANAQAAQLGAQLQLTQAQSQVEYKEALDHLDNQMDTENISKELLDSIAKKVANGEYGGTMWDSQFGVASDLGQLTNVTEDTIKALKEYGRTLDSLDQKTKSYYDALTATAVANAKVVEGTEDLAQGFMNVNRFDALYIKEFNAMEGMKFADIKTQLAQQLGYDNYSQYKNEHGEIDDESARVQLAQVRAQQKATQSVEVFSKNVKQLPSIMKDAYSRQDLHGLTQTQVNEELEAMQFDFNGDPTKEAEKVRARASELWKEMDDDMKAAFGDYIDFEKDYINSVFGSYGALKDATEAFETFGGSAEAFKDKLDAGSLKQLGDNLNQIFIAGGSEGAQKIQEEISSIMDQMDTDKAQEFVNILNGVDWTNANSIETLDETLEGLGVDIPDDQIEKLTSDMIKLGAATYRINLENVNEQLEKFGTLAAKISSGEQGRTGFSKEDMEAAISAGISSSDFFYDVNSGTFTYIGDTVQDIYNALLEQNEKLVGKDALQAQLDNGEKFNKVYEAYGGQVDTSDAEELRKFLIDYIAEGGTNVSMEAVSKRIGDVEGLYELYSIARQNAENYDENVAAFNQVVAKEEQITEGLTSILDNAEAGNLGAVQNQAALAGVTGSLYENNKDDINSLALIGETFQKASSLGIDTEELSAYITELKKIKPLLTDVEAAQVALSNTRSNKGMKTLVDTYDSWTSLLKEDGTLMTDLDSDSAKVLADMKQGVNDLLNTSKELPDSFYKSAENLALIKQAAEGSEEAFYNLRVAAAKELTVGINVDEAPLEELYNYILTFSPTMEVGTAMDIEPIQNAFAALEKSGKMTAEDIQGFFNALGVELEVEYENLPYYEILPNGQSIVAYKKTAVAVKPKKGSGGNYTGGPSGFKSAKDKSGSGGGSSGKTDTWENPFDELYNLTEKINESLRTREELERKYQKLLKNTASTVGEVSKAYYKQIEQLRYEADLQKQMQAGRARQIDNVLNETYTDSEGNRKTYAELGVGKYASYNKETGLLQIDWSALQALEGDPSKVEEGKAAEAYIKRLEELQQMYEEVRDKLWDIEDQIEQLREEAIDNYLSFEDRVMNALVSSYQKQIDEYQDLSDKIKEAEDEIIDGLRDQIELSRQIRDNTKKEEDIAKKEARLAYLRRDTSGANTLEIKKLEEEIANAREEYSDQLIDQQIAQMQKDAENAQKQREKQIEIMQAQLDYAKENGELWQEVWDLMAGAVDSDGNFSQNSQLVQLLKEEEAYKSLSRVGQEKWWEEAAKAFKEAKVGLGEAEDKYGRDMNGDGSVSRGSTGGGSGVEPLPQAQPSTGGTGGGAGQTDSGHFANITHSPNQMTKSEIKELQMALNDAGFTDAAGNKLDVDGKYGPKTTQAVKKLQAALGGLDVDGRFGAKTRAAVMGSQWAAFKTGGLADFTGPAWMDGTSAHPELVLNAQDTENFIALKDILANLMSGQGGGLINGGDNYFDINISAEIGSDYDVTKLSEQIKKEIYNDSMYRNVNTISYRH